LTGKPQDVPDHDPAAVAAHKGSLPPRGCAIKAIEIPQVVRDGSEGGTTEDPPQLEHLGVVELEHNARNNRVRAIG